MKAASVTITKERGRKAGGWRHSFRSFDWRPYTRGARVPVGFYKAESARDGIATLSLTSERIGLNFNTSGDRIPRRWGKK
eukprot:m.5758 g.5758  ORF g.5758 m.5758 type:complete len:80 (+) comp14064_c0_seq1:416-655(+)